MDRKTIALRIATRKLASDDPTEEIGRKIKNHIDNLRDKVRDLKDDIEDTNDLIDVIEKAWKDWDIDRLENFYVITSAEARELERAMESQ